MKTLTQMGSDAKKASTYLAKLGIKERNNALLKVADALVKRSDYIREANAIDLANGKKNNMSTALLDRLMLTESRIEGMADGLRVLAGLDDPIGEVKSMKTRPNGLMIGKKTVPLGVVAIIYESRPNVTADAFGLCFKSANACILRGGSDSVNSNIAIVNTVGAQKVVATAIRQAAHGGLIKAVGTGERLVEGAVTAGGKNAQLHPGLLGGSSGCAGQFPGVACVGYISTI